MHARFCATVCAFIGAVMLLTFPADAAIRHFQANLDGPQEVPPSISPGFGFAELVVDDATNAVVVTNGTYQDLLSGAVSVSLQLAPAGSNGGTFLMFTLNNPGTTAGA